ncbi:MAG: hypothetical protein RLZZ440_1226 [Planctomycetota bacterium]
MTTAFNRVSWLQRARLSTTTRSALRLVVAVGIAGPVAGLDSLRAAEQPQVARGRIVDPAVVPAGAMPCTNCGPACGGHGGLHGHHHGCRDGQCVPYCPVRPDRYGYYGTQWRKWPGQQVMQVSNNQAVAPVSPPRSEVPGADEESMNPNAGDLPAPAPQAAAPLTAPAPDLLPPRPETEPAPAARQPEPAAPAPAPAPTPTETPTPPPAPPTVKPEPTPAPAQPRPEDENLFEADSGWRAKRKFAVTQRDADVQAASHAAAASPRLVPRVPFDAAAETKRLRVAGGR